MTSASPHSLAIGTTNISSPTVADDMVLMAKTPLQLQTLLNLATLYANEEHYVIHPQKTVVVPHNNKETIPLLSHHGVSMKRKSP